MDFAEFDKKRKDAIIAICICMSRYHMTASIVADWLDQFFVQLPSAREAFLSDALVPLWIF